MRSTQDYINTLKDELDRLQTDEIDSVIRLLKKTKGSSTQIFLAGNGGSAATVNHFMCDFSKNAVPGDIGRFRVISLANSVSSITALGNDFTYSDVFVEQLKNLMNDGDILIAVSASGNSPNIIKACEYVKSRKGVVVGLTGFDGGRLHRLADLPVHCDCDCIEQVEDMHLMVLHILVCAFKFGF
ncbi:MAG: SIS domain-containing protein [Peptococcaceae bacterium]|uniref:SIS domain-containing protein n=1 Tax=Zongyangia sp. HA2173 TaxID=3133035 RepID=UPI00174867DF